MKKYNMTFEEAQEYISRRGFDIPWNDCDVFVDERYITQTVGNVLKWADNNPVEYTRTDAFIEKAAVFFEENIKEEDCKFGSSEWTELRAEYESLDSFIRAFKNYMEGK